MHVEKECGLALQGHPRSLILVPIESVHVRNFLLVIKSNFVPTLPRFRDIAAFLLKTVTPPPIPRFFHPNFRAVALRPDWGS